MARSLEPSAPTIIWVLCPAGAKRGARCGFGGASGSERGFRVASPLSSCAERICAIVRLMAPASFSGAKRVRDSAVGSSILTLKRSA